MPACPTARWKAWSSKAKEAYYLALRQTQGTISSEVPKWQPWLLFFLRSLAEQIRRLNRKIKREKLVLAVLPELSLQIVEVTREHGRRHPTYGQKPQHTEAAFSGVGRLRAAPPAGCRAGAWYERR